METVFAAKLTCVICSGRSCFACVSCLRCVCVFRTANDWDLGGGGGGEGGVGAGGRRNAMTEEDELRERLNRLESSFRQDVAVERIVLGEARAGCFVCVSCQWENLESAKQCVACGDDQNMV